jgi:nucleoside-diphosphate-sugar epimerase
LFLAEQVRRTPDMRVVAIVRDARAARENPRLAKTVESLGDRITFIEVAFPAFRLEGSQRERLRETDAVWHFAASTSLHPSADAEEMMSINVMGTQRLLQELESAGASPAFYHISTAYIAGCREGTVTEDELDTGQSHRNSYERSKLQAEQLVRQWFDAGNRGMIFRPSLVLETYSTNGFKKITSLFVYLVMRAVDLGEKSLTLRMRREAGINMIPDDWAVEVMAGLATMAPPDGKAFHLTAREPVRMGDIADVIQATVQGFRIHFDPEAPLRSLTGCSRLLDAALAELQPYLNANIHFDRRNTTAVLGDRFTEPLINLQDRARVVLAGSGARSPTPK